MDSVYTSVKRQRKSVHIIRGKPSAIARRLKASAMKKLAFHRADEGNLSKTNSEELLKNEVGDADAINLQRGPVKIKLKRRKKKILQPEEPAMHNATDNNESCDSILKLKFNYSYEDFLNDFNMKDLPEECIQVLNEQCKTGQRNCLYDQTSPNGKDVYEFDEDEDNNAIQPLSRKPNASKNESKTEDAEPVEEKRDYSGKIKLTLKMKKSSVLDDMLEVVNTMQVMEPQYEVLRVEAD